MILKFNGEEKDFPAEIDTVSKLLAFSEIKTEKAAVELNGQIITPDQFAHTQLQNQDILEVVSFVGGG